VEQPVAWNASPLTRASNNCLFVASPPAASAACDTANDTAIMLDTNGPRALWKTCATDVDAAKLVRVDGCSRGRSQRAFTLGRPGEARDSIVAKDSTHVAKAG
jgi:hypothetical protein